MAKIFVFLGHPDTETFCNKLADSYEAGARAGGHEVRRMNIGDLKFDPVLHKGYHAIQPLEPDLVQVQENFKWADHIVVVYPNWWSSMPGLLKGMFDRMFLPGFAFHFNKSHTMWHGLLHGRTARVVVTMDNWPIMARLLFGDFTNEINRAILHFAGIKVKVTKVGPVARMSDKQKTCWIEQMGAWGKRGR